jgi:hypothetical protein
MAILSAFSRPSLRLTSRTRIWLILPFLLLESSFVLPVQTKTSPEYQVKAVFLFNFTQFVEWPANAFPSEQSPFVIGVLGEDPFGSYLDETAQGEKVNGHPLLVRRLQNAEEARLCHILFINWGKGDKLKQLLADLKGRSLLTVSDAADFARQGGMVRFITENGKIRIRINLEATKAANLTVSSKLLRLAEIVDSKNN